MKYEEAFDKSCELRDDFWRQYGELDPIVIAFIVNPSFQGGPRWPSIREAFKVVHTEKGTILASDGLSDPYDNMDEEPANKDYNGLGIELYIQTEDKLTPDSPGNWQSNLIIQMSQQAAYMGNMVTSLEQYTHLTMSLPDVNVPEKFLVNNCAGVFIGLEDPVIASTLKLALEEIKVVNIKLMTRAELEYASEQGVNLIERRAHLAKLYKQQENSTYSYLDRHSVI